MKGIAGYQPNVIDARDPKWKGGRRPYIPNEKILDGEEQYYDLDAEYEEEYKEDPSAPDLSFDQDQLFKKKVKELRKAQLAAEKAKSNKKGVADEVKAKNTTTKEEKIELNNMKQMTEMSDEDRGPMTQEEIDEFTKKHAEEQGRDPPTNHPRFDGNEIEMRPFHSHKRDPTSPDHMVTKYSNGKSFLNSKQKGSNNNSTK